MAKGAKAPKAYKLRFKPTPISRLRHYRYPLKMVGDPVWSGHGAQAWRNREKAVYAYEMDRKDNSCGYSLDTYNRALNDNERLDYLIKTKWDDYEDALADDRWHVIDQAERDNAAWDYHHDNFIAA